MKITDEFYSNLNDREVEKRIASIGKGMLSDNDDTEAINLFKAFLVWKQNLNK